MNKVFSKTKSVKKQIVELQNYKIALIGKKYISYGGGIDTILDVLGNNKHEIEYQVMNENNVIRYHATFINPKKLIV